MARSSPYPITLDAQERQELQRRAAAYTLPYYQVLRAKMILYAAQGLSNDQIAQSLSGKLHLCQINHEKPKVFVSRIAQKRPFQTGSQRLDSRREVISLWRKRFYEDRMAGLEEHSRPGRPRSFPP